MVFGLFSKDRALKKTIDRATNRLAQSPDRWAAMEKLRDIGTDEALEGLCRRFSFSYDKTIEDQQEKRWVVDVLGGKGETAIAPLRRYMMNASSLGYPLQALERMASREAALEVVDALLAAEEPGYTRDPKKRIDIIEWLDAWEGASGEEVLRRVLPYLGDFDEQVRFKTIEAAANNPHPSAAEPLVGALVNEEEESIRLRQRIAEVLAEQGLPLGDQVERVEALTQSVIPGYKVVGDRLHKK